METRNRKKPYVDAQFPQWNSKLSFSAQKADAGTQEDHSTKEPARRTPLGQPRRIPLGKEARAQNAKGNTSSNPTRQTPGNSDKTPTICLFQQFESLTIGTPGATAGRTTVAGGPASGDEGHKPRRSVAFGTPSVLTYTPAAVPAAAEVTPLWSNAGHTPYSLEGSSAPAFIQESDHTHFCDKGSSSSGVCVELFSSVITDTGAGQTPAARANPQTPLLGPAATPAANESGGVETAASLTAMTAAATPRLIGFASTPAAVDTDGIDLQTPATEHVQSTRHPSAVSRPSFTGFSAAQEGPGKSSQNDGTPPFFSKTAGAATSAAAAQQVAEDSKPALTTAAAGAAADGIGSLPATTPKSKLKQPARVPVSASRPAVPSELKQLLGERAEVGILSAATKNKSLLGTCDILSPVRPKKQQQQNLGAEQQVLTPVRRSARKASRQLVTDTEHVKPMLEATNYCYQPNEALRDLQHRV